MIGQSIIEYMLLLAAIIGAIILARGVISDKVKQGYVSLGNKFVESVNNVQI